MIEIPADTALSERLRGRIRREGPIAFAEWMQAALYDPIDGYYSREDLTRWGREGDYRTSPEISSLFSATFARYFSELYDRLGRPDRFTIVESGAGNAKFAHGVLRTLKGSFPEVFAATRYFIDEINGGSVRRVLTEFSDRVGYGDLEESAIDGGVIFSNELLDAFPVHRVTVENGKLREFYVDLEQDGGLQWTLRPASIELKTYLDEFNIVLAEGQIAEINLAARNWLQKAAASLQNGFLVTVDYGAEAEALYSNEARRLGTLRGYQRHKLIEDVLENPGQIDITSTINWTDVVRTGEQLGLTVVSFESQDKFLLGAGLLTQLEDELLNLSSDAERLRLTTAAREMVLPGGMASHFQVLVQERTMRQRPG